MIPPRKHPTQSLQASRPGLGFQKKQCWPYYASMLNASQQAEASNPPTTQTPRNIMSIDRFQMPAHRSWASAASDDQSRRSLLTGAGHRQEGPQNCTPHHLSHKYHHHMHVVCQFLLNLSGPHSFQSTSTLVILHQSRPESTYTVPASVSPTKEANTAPSTTDSARLTAAVSIALLVVWLREGVSGAAKTAAMTGVLPSDGCRS